MTFVDFADFVSTPAGRRATKLLAGKATTLKQLFGDVYSAVKGSNANRGGGALRTTEQLCGDRMWNSLGIAERRIVGMCLAYQVSIKAVPLTLHRTPSGKGSRRYVELVQKRGV